MREARPIAIRAPAKVNLGLRIVGVRADGYHEIDSLFVPLDLADELVVAVEAAREREVTVTVERVPGVPGEVPADRSNLAARAAGDFLAAAHLEARVRIELRKYIPSPGGLGGGSSDAAAVLRALAGCFPAALAPEALGALARSLGADVPFFLGPGGRGPVPVRAAGIGERLVPAPDVPCLALLLVHPGVTLETPRVYAEFDRMASLTGSGGATRMPALPGWPDAPAGPDRWRSAEWLSQLLVNDLQPAAERLAPVIVRVREALSASGARGVGLSGSGPTLFGIFPDASAASVALAGAKVRAALSPGTGPSPAASAGGLWMRMARTLRPSDAA